MARLAILLLGIAVLAAAQTTGQKAKGPGPGGQVARGKYLVSEVAKCGDCHSPRAKSGEFDQDRWLQGTPLGYHPLVATSNWADVAPGIAGLPGWTEAEAIAFLETGQTPNHIPPRPPMHVYHMSGEDASAIVAYLKSLRPPGK